MIRDPDRRRRTLRLKNYDYAEPAAYFVTIVTHDRACLFARLEADEMRLNQLGLVAAEVWLDLPTHYPHVELDEFVVMPNHLHGIITLLDQPDVSVDGTETHLGELPGDGGRAGFKPAPTGGTVRRRQALPEIVRAFKTFSARRINLARGTRGTPVWQRGYYEHIIRNDASLDRIRQYILGNPAAWSNDRENPFADVTG
ncbi:MAG TPA: transposase [Nitrolancea sp.]|nr:transposase [Nitrolancea sp.]